MRTLQLALSGTLDRKVTEFDDSLRREWNLEHEARRPWDVHLPSNLTNKNVQERQGKLDSLTNVLNPIYHHLPQSVHVTIAHEIKASTESKRVKNIRMHFKFTILMQLTPCRP